LPILKRRSHTQSLRAAATSGNPKFFLGTDSAPHAKELKENSCGCAGIYSSPAAIELYAEVFEELDALDRLEAFASFHGADFYGLARNQEEVTLQKSEWLAPPSYQLDKTSVVPIRANEAIRWKLVKDNP
jgi:dihydroorotase